MPTLVVDVGQNLVGVFEVEAQIYTSYKGNDIAAALKKIAWADEVVTYNGSRYDLAELGKLAGLGDADLPLRGRHVDMRSIIWSDRILGRSLRETYKSHYSEPPAFLDTHEGSPECDTYMTWRLWELWKRGKLKIVDGHHVWPPP